MYKLFILAFVTLYFCYYLITSHNGDLSINKIILKLKDGTEQLHLLQKERTLLESKLKSLRSGHIEEDLIDEIARREIGLAEPDELVIIINKKR